MIEKNSSSPMYEQIYISIKNDILDGKFQYSNNIGTQTELAEKFGVSLITIKKAMKLLLDDDLIEIKQGKGTFVKKPVMLDNLNRLTGTTNILKEDKIKADISVIKFEVCNTPHNFGDDVKKMLGNKCIHIERLHKVQNRVIAFADMYLPEKYENLISIQDVLNNTIYSIYQNKLGVQLGNGIQKIQADSANGYVAKLLNVSNKEPIMKIERKAFDAQGNLIEYMKLYYECNSYSIEVNLKLSAE